jgi:hypothetical protein
VAYEHKDKAALLAQRFFPEADIDLTDVRDTSWADGTGQGAFDISRTVDADEVKQILQQAKPWKAPGEDLLPVGFLKACSRPLYEALAKVASASLALEYFPEQWRKAIVVVLRKPGKTAKQLELVNGWRPVSLLCVLGKVIEAIVGNRVAAAAEEHKLLPDGQMGNRRNRSTELAIRLVTEQVHEAWKHKAIASLLQLDIKGAFDHVNYIRTLDTLRYMGFPLWLVRWVGSYLSRRSAVLRFDGKDTGQIPIKAGVPQGSPLSPILFSLYLASLYQLLEADGRCSVVGFADDTNLLVFGRSGQANVQTLEALWGICQQWARTRGMQFEPGKSELIHFTRT